MAEYIDREAITEYLMGRIKDYLEMDDRLATIPLKFAMAYIQHLPAADVEPVRRWIPCSERLPEGVNRCLVFRYDYVTKTRFVDILWLEHGSWWNRLHGGNYAVTHWMPLPEPPEMEGGGKDG